MKARRLLIFLLTVSLFATVGCQKQENDIVLIPYTQPAVDKKPITVNIASKIIHLREDCIHIGRTSPENLRYAEHTSDNVNTLLDMEYRFCEVCSAPAE
jgi:hypothetical protein